MPCGCVWMLSESGGRDRHTVALRVLCGDPVRGQVSLRKECRSWPRLGHSGHACCSQNSMQELSIPKESLSEQGRKGARSFQVMSTNLWGTEEVIIECGAGSCWDSSLLDRGFGKGQWLFRTAAYEMRLFCFNSSAPTPGTHFVLSEIKQSCSSPRHLFSPLVISATRVRLCHISTSPFPVSLAVDVQTVP